MLNEACMEGYVSGRSWTYNDDQFFRLASYRDRTRPSKRKENRDEPDYVTVQLRSTGIPVTLISGMKVRVHGYIQSREYHETLDEWLKNAKGPTNALSVSDDLRKDLKHNRIVTEFVCEKVIVLSMPEASDSEASGEQKPAKNGRKSTPAPAAEASPA